MAIIENYLNGNKRYGECGAVPFFNPKLYRGLKLENKCRPRMNLDEILKAHKYPGFLNMINSCESMEDIKHVRNDLNIGINQIKTIRDRLYKCETLGDCEKTKNYYKNIKRLYIDKDITSKDADLYLKWLNEVARKALNDRAKEIRESLKESFENIDEVVIMNKEARKSLEDIEFSYDKKYNAFCLSVSSYPVEKLESMLDKKQNELKDAKFQKKLAKDRQSKLEAQIKIDYLQNVVDKCNSLIKKKKA